MKRFFWIILPVIGFALVVVLALTAYRTWKAKQAKKAFAKTIEGKIQSHVDKCETQIKKNQTEIEEIKQNIADIIFRMQNANTINDNTKKESNRIIKGFEMELQVRNEKISFYETCLDKLNTILANHKLANELEEKEAKLRKLQENNYEDISEMEALKTELSFDKIYIESIENLSLRMLRSNSLESAKKLKLELNEITKELREL